MEPVTHVLTGICLARAGVARRTAYATLAMAIAAEFPDIDVLWSLQGPISGFQHHRGLTHTLIGMPFEAGFLLLLFATFHFWLRPGRSRAETSVGSGKRSVVDWVWLYGGILLALGSHLVLDFTNNYGIRPLYPFRPEWHAASIVFIFDPLLFAILLAGCLGPSLFGLISREISGEAHGLPGVGWPRGALVLVLCLWGLRACEHHRAFALVEYASIRSAGKELKSTEDSLTEPGPVNDRPILEPLRTLASPDPINPFRWFLALDYGPTYALATADTWTGTFQMVQRLEKQQSSPVILDAERSKLGRAYLEWSPMPWIRFLPDPAHNGSSGTVIFEDLRFMGDMPLLHKKDLPPLTGEVQILRNGGTGREGLDGRYGK